MTTRPVHSRPMERSPFRPHAALKLMWSVDEELGPSAAVRAVAVPLAPYTLSAQQRRLWPDCVPPSVRIAPSISSDSVDAGQRITAALMMQVWMMR